MVASVIMNPFSAFPNIDYGSSLPDWLMVALTFAYVVVTWRLWKTSLKNQRDLASVNSPCVMVENTQVGNLPLSTNGQLTVTYKNYGKSVAQNIRLEMGTGSEEESQNMNLAEADLALPPENIKYISIDLDAHDLEAIRRSTIPFHVRVRISFDSQNKDKFVHDFLAYYDSAKWLFKTKKSTIKTL